MNMWQINASSSKAQTQVNKEIASEQENQYFGWVRTL